MNEWSLTALGMGTVFAALIGLALVVSLFPLVFRKKEKPIKDHAPLPSLTSVAPARPAAVPASAGGDAQLVAVLTAAVCAASGMGAGQFRITQVAPVQSGGFTTPVWGHVDRLSRPTSIR